MPIPNHNSTSVCVSFDCSEHLNPNSHASKAGLPSIQGDLLRRIPQGQHRSNNINKNKAMGYEFRQVSAGSHKQPQLTNLKQTKQKHVFLDNGGAYFSG